MSGKGISRNDPCPCGSGKKFKHCCIGKGIDWQARRAGPRAALTPPLPPPRAAPHPDFVALGPYRVVDARLKEIARASAGPAAWKDLVGRLSDATPDEERLRAFRAVRGAGVLSEDAGCFLIDHVIQWTFPEDDPKAE